MITIILAIAVTGLLLLLYGVLVKLVRNQQKALKICRDFGRTVHKLCLENAESEPFARIVLDEHRKYSDQLFDLGEPKNTKAQGKAGR